MPKFMNFIIGFIGVLILEWVGIAIFIVESGRGTLLAYEILRIRCILMMYIFVQLRKITFGQKQNSSRKPEENPPQVEHTIKLKECTDTVRIVHHDTHRPSTASVSPATRP
jgi:hypothetical protein